MLLARLPGEGFQKYVPDFIFAPALATTLLTMVTPILFDRYDKQREARQKRRTARIATPAAGRAGGGAAAEGKKQA